MKTNEILNIALFLIYFIKTNAFYSDTDLFLMNYHVMWNIQ